MSVSEGMCKPHYGNQDFSPLATGIYFIVIMKKTPLHNGNSLMTDQNGSSTTHAFEQCPGEKMLPGTFLSNLMSQI